LILVHFFYYRPLVTLTVLISGVFFVLHYFLLITVNRNHEDSFQEFIVKYIKIRAAEFNY